MNCTTSWLWMLSRTCLASVRILPRCRIDFIRLARCLPTATGLQAPRSMTCFASCDGMPVWSVSEPNINLWLHDEPLAYPSALSGKISFRLSYKQRDYNMIDGGAIAISHNFSSLGYNWHCSWLSYIQRSGDWTLNGKRCLMLPDGGWCWYSYNNSIGSDFVTNPYFPNKLHKQELETYNKAA